ncbi:MAG: AsmA-like C-terminal region-containing protein [bacterium]
MKKFLVVLIALAVVSGGAGVLLSIGPVNKMAKKYVGDEMKKALPCKYKLGNISAGMMRGVELQDLRLYDTSGDEFLYIHSLRLTFGLGSIIHPKNPFTAIVIEQAKARVTRDSSGRVNIIQIMDKMQKQKNSDATIPRIKLYAMQMEWSDYKLGKNPPREKFNIISADIETGDSGAINIRNIRVQKGQTVVNLRGKWNDTPGAPVDLRIRVKPLVIKDMLALRRSLSDTRALPELHIGGEGVFDCRISGPRGKEQPQGELTIENGTLGAQKIRRLSINFSPGADGRIEIRDFDVRSENGGRLRAGGAVAPAEPWKFDIKAKADRFPIDALIGLTVAQPQLSGALDADLAVKGDSNNLKTISGEGDVAIRNGEIIGVGDAGDPPTPFRTMQASLKASNGVVQISKGRLDSEELLLQLDGNIGLDRTLDLSGKCEVSKRRVRRGIFKKIVTSVLPDGGVGYRFPIRIRGTFDKPDVSVKSGKLATDTVSDPIRDAGNKVQKFMKKVF